jgi:sterol desaturase/sphingolipid hydroxylase (fatty acid hydroxylase superfamily)
MKKHIILILLFVFFGLTCYLMLTYNPLSFFSGITFGYLLAISKKYEYSFEKGYKKFMRKLFFNDEL